MAVATADGETHRLWVVDDPPALRAVGGAFATRPLYVADGHHRYKTAQVYRDERRQAPAGSGDADAGHEFALMLLVPLDDPGLVVLPHAPPGAPRRAPSGGACARPWKRR